MAGKLSDLEAWVAQALNFETQIVIVHDHRDDKTQTELEEIVEKFCSEKLTLLTGKYGNPGTARNAGMQNLNSEWTCFWDSDDFPNVANVFAEIKSSRSTSDLLVGQFLVFDKNQNPVQKKSSSTQSLEDFILNPGLWRVLIRSKLIQKIQFPSLKMGEDQIFLEKLNLANLQIEFSQEVFYHYVVGETSQLTRSEAAIQDLRYAIKELYESIPIKSTSNLHVTLIMLVRICITALKRGDFKLRDYSIRPLLLAFFKLGPKKSVAILKKIAKVH
jgi:glycosyltransferase involved in cell wall biosynthesis